MISGGRPASIVDGSVGWGDALVLGGVLSFVLYSLGAAEFRDFSPLRYTALTASLGWLSVAAATVDRARHRPRAAAERRRLWSVTPQIAYLAIPGAFIAVLTWNSAIARHRPAEHGAVLAT